MDSTPKRVRSASGLEFAGLEIAGDYTCGVTVGGTAYCWGGKYSNATGALGIGSTDTIAHPTPRAVVGGQVFAAVSTGGSHTCGLTPSGSVYCWGSNELGKLGDSTTTPRSAPVLVSGGHTFRAVSAGAENTCAVTTDNDAYCWGSGTQLGNGTTTRDPGGSTPVPVSGGLRFASINPGGFHTCGVTTENVAYCWGSGSAGVLGDGSQTDRTTPVRVSGQ